MDSKDKKALKRVTQELEKSFEIRKVSNNGTDPWRAVLFILEKLNSGGYYGTISVKINGTNIFDPVEQEVKHRLDLLYNEDGENVT